MIIRNSWGSSTAYDHANLTRTLFVCGLSSDEEVNRLLRFESYKFNDIIQASFMDTYKNLTFKTLLGLKWATSYYDMSTVKFILKIDDDVVPNMPRILDYLHVLTERHPEYARNTYLGYLYYKMEVSRISTMKFYVSEIEFNSSFYPVYCIGLGYMMTTDLAQRISEIEDHPGFLNIEDIYVTGILGNRLNASHIDLNSNYNLWSPSRDVIRKKTHAQVFFYFPLVGRSFLKVCRFVYGCYDS